MVSVLGRGGMGEVYRADDLKLGSVVALKFLPETVEQNARKLEMLVSEVRIARSVSHPNVCRVHDIGVHGEGQDALHFLSMEFIDGEDLASLLRRIGRLPGDKALEVSRELCAGLAAVHARGLLHRDIKPGNVMIDGRGRVRLADFGLAVAGLEGAGYAGTPAYMAPEQLTTQTTTVRSDLYALGLVLYEVFTGHRAFESRSPLEVAYLHLERAPKPPTHWAPDLDPGVEQILLGCLEKHPEQRPTSAEEVAEALARIGSEEPALVGGRGPSKDVLRAHLRYELVRDTLPVEARQPPGPDRWHERLVRDLLARHEGREVDDAKGPLLLFESPLRALSFALDLHRALEQCSGREECGVAARIGIHFGEVQRSESLEGIAQSGRPGGLGEIGRLMSVGLMALAGPGQTLLSRDAFDLARRAVVERDDTADLRWLDHGAWRLQDVADPVDVFEVGRADRVPLEKPTETEGARRLVMQPRVEGWRPAPGSRMPQRPHWKVERRLGAGGYGEVWLVGHVKTGERRSYKFCFDAERLRALQREITLFRLLKEELGERDDINRILDWNLDEAPYFIESEYTSAGDLGEWAESVGGLSAVPRETRLEIVAQVATALGAAHSVGVLHKDVKPSNVLIQATSDGGVQAQLADFGVGQVTERDRLAAAGITVLGLSGRLFEDSTSGISGTRLYMAPELLEGHAPTLQADLYALGVMLYQLVVGDLGRALAPGWRRDIDDELLAEDIACFVDRSPARRPASAREVAESLRNLDTRRREREALLAAQRVLRDSQRRRRVYQAVATTALAALVVVSVLALWAVHAGREERRAREASEQILDFVVSLFEIADPYGTAGHWEKRGETITAREILDLGTLRVATEFDEQPLVRARLMANFGDIYRSLGLFDSAGPLIDQALDTRRNLLGDEHPDVATSLHLRAELLLARGDYTAANSIYRESLALRQRLLGAEHPETLRSTRGVALSLRGMGDFEASRELLEETVEIQEQRLGLQHPDTLETTHLLATSLLHIGEYGRGQKLLAQTLNIEEQVLGAEHPTTLSTQHQLAISLFFVGDYRRARSLLERTLEYRERVLGIEHPATLEVRGHLGIYLIHLGDFGGAQEVLEQTLEQQGRALGAEHPLTLWTAATLARCLDAQGLYSEARELQESSHGILQRLLGSEHPQSQRFRAHRVRTLTHLGEFSEARRLLEPALETLSGDWAGHPPEIVVAAYHLSVALRDLGELGQAEELQERTLGHKERVFGPHHLFTLLSMGNLARIYCLQGDLGRARALQGRTLALHGQMLHPEHPATLVLESQLADTLWRLGETERALEVAGAALEGLERVLGPEHPAASQATRLLLAIAIEENDPESTSRWLDELRW